MARSQTLDRLVETKERLCVRTSIQGELEEFLGVLLAYDSFGYTIERRETGLLGDVVFVPRERLYYIGIPSELLREEEPENYAKKKNEVSLEYDNVSGHVLFDGEPVLIGDGTPLRYKPGGKMAKVVETLCEAGEEGVVRGVICEITGFQNGVQYISKIRRDFQSIGLTVEKLNGKFRLKQQEVSDERLPEYDPQLGTLTIEGEPVLTEEGKVLRFDPERNKARLVQVLCEAGASGTKRSTLLEIFGEENKLACQVRELKRSLLTAGYTVRKRGDYYRIQKVS